MEYSKNFNFALPSRDNDVDLADINEISNNFRKIDENSVKKEVGKGLSTNDFTDEYKAKVENALTSENIDTEMSDTSENPVQNKAVKGYIDDNTKQGHLIYQTTLTEDTHQISISKDNNGNLLSLNSFAVIVCIPASPTLNTFAYLSLKINNFIPYNNLTVISGGEEGKKHVVIYRCDRDNGLWSRMAGTTLNRNYTDMFTPSVKGVEYWDYYVNKFEAARNITLSPTGADSVIPKGTKIEVYGR